MLQVRGLEISYGAVRAVQGIDFEVGAGEVLALLGPNGAGKTSTLRAITALTHYRGSILFDGEEVSKLGTEACARRGLIHVPEGRHVFPTLSVHENLQVGTTAASGRKSEYSIDDVYDLFPALTPLRDREGWALSGGEQQMVAFARALIKKPKLVLMDEPSMGLAPALVTRCFEIIDEIRQTGVSVLMVEQNARAALRVADYAYVLASGQIAVRGTPDVVADDPMMKEAYLGKQV